MNSYIVLSILFCIACYVSAETEDLNPLVKSSEEALSKAKSHVDLMLNLDPLPNHDKVPSLVKNESEHLAYEIKEFAKKLHDTIQEGDHKPEVKEAVTTGVTHLNEAAGTLEHVGSDLKQDNLAYYGAIDKLLHEIKTIQATGPCDRINPILKHALNELVHDVNNYQYGIHNLVGAHEGSPHEASHHVHSHHGSKSSEESSEESHDHSHHEHSHHDHSHHHHH